MSVDPLLTKLRSAQQAQKLAETTVIRDPLDGIICRLWRGLWDTNEIARLSGHPESEVANRLAALRDGGAL